jgi:hypothetical protein
MAAKSYSWSSPLSASVAPGSDATVPTPGFHSPENYDTANAEAVWNGTVLTSENSAISFDPDWSQAKVTNNGDDTWMAGDTISVVVAAKHFDPADIQGSFEALDERVTTLEGSVTTLEGSVADLETRVEALEAAAPPASRGHGQGPATVRRK